MTDNSFLQNRLKSLSNPKQKILIEVPPFPKNIMLEISNACNHACIFCANTKMSRKKKPIDPDLAYRIMQEAYDLGTQEIGFYTTGEPFVHIGLEKFIGEAKRIGYTYTYISTNGALATPERSKNAIDAGLDSIKFSVNAASRETYKAIHGKDDWDKVVSNIKFIADYRKTLNRTLKLGMSFIATDQTRHEKENIKNLFGELVDDILFHEADWQQGYMVENREFVAPATQNVMMKAPCYMVFNRVHISCEGYLTSCCVDYQNYLATSDLNTISLKDAWESEAFKALRRRHLENKLEGTLCYNCLNGTQTEIQPLEPSLATTINFDEASKVNLNKQKKRFTIIN